MVRTYSGCYSCGGAVVEKRITREAWWDGKLHLIDNVPVGVCGQCGEKIVLPEIAKSIDKVLGGEVSPDHFVQVPAYQFPEKELVS